MADTPSFDLVEFGYSSANFEGLSQNLTGQELAGSVTVGEHFFVTGSFFRVDAKDSEDKLEIRTYGLGYKYDFSNETALYSELTGIFIDPDGHDNHEKGYELKSGIRHNINDRIELNIAAKINNTDSYDVVTLVTGAAYNFTRHIAIYSDFNVEKDYTRVSFGARYTF